MQSVEVKEKRTIRNVFIELGIKKNRPLKYEGLKNCEKGAFLTARYKNCILDHANGILDSYFTDRKRLEKIGKIVNKPVVKNICIKLSDKVFKPVKGDGSFDFWLKLKDLEKRGKSYRYANKYFESWDLGTDIGYRKLTTTSRGEAYGRHIKGIVERVVNKAQGSKKWKQAKSYLRTEIDRVLEKVIYGTFSPVLEKLRYLKKNKGRRWSKEVNKGFNHWIYEYVLRKIKELRDVAGIQWHAVITGARYVLLRFVKELKVPLPAKPVLIGNKCV